MVGSTPHPVYLRNAIIPSRQVGEESGNMPCEECPGVFVHLAYLDDSGTGDKKKVNQVMSAVIMEGKEFSAIEIMMGIFADALVSPDKWQQFEEFHAYELYGGYGPFEGVPQDKRFKAIETLMTWVNRHNIPLIYGAVNKKQLAETAYGSANPLDICFRYCVQGIEMWAIRQDMAAMKEGTRSASGPHPLIVLVTDDFQDKQTKQTLRASFFDLRKRIARPGGTLGINWHLHDALYFGNSKDSVGLQFADLCSYVISKHLEGDPATEGFFRMIEKQIAYYETGPK